MPESGMYSSSTTSGMNYSLGLYLPPQLSSMVHFGGDRVAAGRLVNLLSASERLNVADGGLKSSIPTPTLSGAPRTGRQDYFAILSFAETERSILQSGLNSIWPQTVSVWRDFGLSYGQ